MTDFITAEENIKIYAEKLVDGLKETVLQSSSDSDITEGELEKLKKLTESGGGVCLVYDMRRVRLVKYV